MKVLAFMGSLRKGDGLRATRMIEKRMKGVYRTVPVEDQGDTN
jgi:hypothetical protein